MATKNSPGQFDCYAKAEPDEPMFVLLGRDPCAPFVVLLWAQMRLALARHRGEEGDQLTEAKECAIAMEEWARKLGKGAAIDKAHEVFHMLLGPSGEPM